MSKSIHPNILICPNCKDSQIVKDESLSCRSCKAEFELSNDCLKFVSYDDDDVGDALDKIKYIVKKNKALYGFLMDLISPVYRRDKILANLIKEVEDKEDVVAINLGSGNSDISNAISNIDIFAYDNVDLTCDISNVPIADNSVDYIFNIAVLEHVPDPEKVVSEIHRILKPNGVVYSRIPFMQGFHASPYDFSRRTEEGMKVLYKSFDQIELKPFGGPTSGMLWIVQEWLALVFSFGIKKLHSFVYMLVLVLTFPIKFLDVLLIHHPMANQISSAFVYVGRKRKTK